MGWLPFGFKASKARTQCQLGVARIKLLRNKKTIQLKQLRREVADLLKADKEDSARIRVEAVLREESLLQAFDILELHLELVGVRATLLEKVETAPEDMVEALSSLVFAAPRLGDDLLPELTVLKQMLARKFGREYAEEACDEATATSKWRVSERLVGLLAVGVPAPEAKAAALAAIAAEFGGVEFDEKAAVEDMRKKGGGGGSGGGGGVGLLAKDPKAAKKKKEEEEKADNAEEEEEEERENLPAPPSGGPSSAKDAAVAARAAADRASAAADEAERYAGESSNAKKGRESLQKAVVAVEVDETATAADGQPKEEKEEAKKKKEKKATPPPPPPAEEESSSSSTSGKQQQNQETEPGPGPFDSVDSVSRAPPPPKNSTSSSSKPAAAPSSSSTSSSSLGFPTPPPNTGGSGGTVAKPSELDELAKRFESLKKGGGNGS